MNMPVGKSYKFYRYAAIMLLASLFVSTTRAGVVTVGAKYASAHFSTPENLLNLEKICKKAEVKAHNSVYGTAKKIVYDYQSTFQSIPEQNEKAKNGKIDDELLKQVKIASLRSLLISHFCEPGSGYSIRQRNAIREAKTEFYAALIKDNFKRGYYDLENGEYTEFMPPFNNIICISDKSDFGKTQFIKKNLPWVSGENIEKIMKDLEKDTAGTLGALSVKNGDFLGLMKFVVANWLNSKDHDEKAKIIEKFRLLEKTPEETMKKFHLSDKADGVDAKDDDSDADSEQGWAKWILAELYKLTEPDTIPEVNEADTSSKQGWIEWIKDGFNGLIRSPAYFHPIKWSNTALRYLYNYPVTSAICAALSIYATGGAWLANPIYLIQYACKFYGYIVVDRILGSLLFSDGKNGLIGGALGLALTPISKPINAIYGALYNVLNEATSCEAPKGKDLDKTKDVLTEKSGDVSCTTLTENDKTLGKNNRLRTTLKKDTVQNSDLSNSDSSTIAPKTGDVLVPDTAKKEPDVKASALNNKSDNAVEQEEVKDQSTTKAVVLTDKSNAIVQVDVKGQSDEEEAILTNDFNEGVEEVMGAQSDEEEAILTNDFNEGVEEVRSRQSDEEKTAITDESSDWEEQEEIGEQSGAEAVILASEVAEPVNTEEIKADLGARDTTVSLDTNQVVDSREIKEHSDERATSLKLKSDKAARSSNQENNKSSSAKAKIDTPTAPSPRSDAAVKPAYGENKIPTNKTVSKAFDKPAEHSAQQKTSEDKSNTKSTNKVGNKAWKNLLRRLLDTLSGYPQESSVKGDPKHKEETKILPEVIKNVDGIMQLINGEPALRNELPKYFEKLLLEYEKDTEDMYELDHDPASATEYMFSNPSNMLNAQRTQELEELGIEPPSYASSFLSRIILAVSALPFGEALKGDSVFDLLSTPLMRIVTLPASIFQYMKNGVVSWAKSGSSAAKNIVYYLSQFTTPAALGSAMVWLHANRYKINPAVLGTTTALMFSADATLLAFSLLDNVAKRFSGKPDPKKDTQTKLVASKKARLWNSDWLGFIPKAMNTLGYCGASCLVYSWLLGALHPIANPILLAGVLKNLIYANLWDRSYGLLENADITSSPTVELLDDYCLDASRLVEDTKRAHEAKAALKSR